MRPLPQCDYDRIAQAIAFIDANFKDQPDLATVAGHVGLSPSHFQRIFSQWAGISPKRFVQYLTAEYARELLAACKTVLDTAYEVGLSGPSRLHDLTVQVYAATPGEISSGGAGLTIAYGIHETPFGYAFIATTDRGIARLNFIEDDGPEPILAALRAEWPHATLIEDLDCTAALIDNVFNTASRCDPVSVWVRGTNFQVRVWDALLKIPTGSAVTYQTIAQTIGKPKAARAVGTAVGANAIAYVIPCHRVIKSTGAFGGYRWGKVRKQAMLGWEAALCERDTV